MTYAQLREEFRASMQRRISVRRLLEQLLKTLLSREDANERSIEYCRNQLENLELEDRFMGQVANIINAFESEKTALKAQVATLTSANASLQAQVSAAPALDAADLAAISTAVADPDLATFLNPPAAPPDAAPAA